MTSRRAARTATKAASLGRKLCAIEIKREKVEKVLRGKREIHWVVLTEWDKGVDSAVRGGEEWTAEDKLRWRRENARGQKYIGWMDSRDGKRYAGLEARTGDENDTLLMERTAMQNRYKAVHKNAGRMVLMELTMDRLERNEKKAEEMGQDVRDRDEERWEIRRRDNRRRRARQLRRWKKNGGARPLSRTARRNRCKEYCGY